MSDPYQDLPTPGSFNRQYPCPCIRESHLTDGAIRLSCVCGWTRIVTEADRQNAVYEHVREVRR